MTRKNKFPLFICILFTVLLFLWGCGKQPAADTNCIEVPEAGLAFQIPEEYLEKGIEISNPYEDNLGHMVVSILWYYRPVTDKLFSDIGNLTEEELTYEVQMEFYQNLNIHSKCLMSLTLIEESEYEAAINNGKIPEELSYWNNTEEFGVNDGYMYLLSIPENETSKMSDEEKAQYEECAAYMQVVKENISFTEKTESEQFPSQMPAFSAKDLSGNIVTESIFAQKDLTVVNIWGTFCSPCVGEMPSLGQWAKDMPDNVQLIGLITDISGDDDTVRHDLAVSIMEKADADFLQIIANQDFYPILKWITGVPTTLFVDKEGNIVGSPIVGADVEGYQKFVEDYLNEH